MHEGNVKKRRGNTGAVPSRPRGRAYPGKYHRRPRRGPLQHQSALTHSFGCVHFVLVHPGIINYLPAAQQLLLTKSNRLLNAIILFRCLLAYRAVRDVSSILHILLSPTISQGRSKTRTSHLNVWVELNGATIKGPFSARFNSI